MNKTFDFLKLSQNLNNNMKPLAEKTIIYSCKISIKNNNTKISLALTKDDLILFSNEKIENQFNTNSIVSALINDSLTELEIEFANNSSISIITNNFTYGLLQMLKKVNQDITFKDKTKKRISFNILTNKNEHRNSASTNVSSKLEKSVSIENYEIIQVIGKGGFANIVLAEKVFTTEQYAIKILDKKEIILNRQIPNILTEKNILKNMQSNFIIKLENCFQDYNKIYFVMDYMPKGNLYKLLKTNKLLQEKEMKFYIASIILGLKDLHSKDYIYRDLKLENILIDKKGYIKLSDFGLSKLVTKNQKSYSVCGTPEYLAPEMIKAEGYDKTIDYWSLGIVTYELLHGHLPYFHKDITKLYIKILKESVNFNSSIDISEDCKDFINRLLSKKPENRLGFKNGIREIIQHPWFKDFDWISLKNQTMKSPVKVKNLKIQFEEYKEESNSIDNIEILNENEFEFDQFFYTKF